MKFLFFFDNVEEDIKTELSFFINNTILANGRHKFIKVLITVRIPYENSAFEPPCKDFLIKGLDTKSIKELFNVHYENKSKTEFTDVGKAIAKPVKDYWD